MASALSFQATLHLLSSEEGGLRDPLPRRSMQSFHIGTVYRGQPVMLDARVTLEDQDHLEPGESCTVLLEPLAEDLWQNIQQGDTFTMHDGRARKGHGTVFSRRDPPRGLLH